MVKEIRLSVAPMMDWTDRHCRFFHRLLNPTIQLYTEMVTTGAILHGDRDRFLRFNGEEHPLVLQLGGSNPLELAECAKIAEDYGYDEVNLNCGCPSDRVQKGAIGACLMTEPEVVARAIDAMKSAISLPVTIKCRIGVDHFDDHEFLQHFIQVNKDSGCNVFIIHARKAWLKGLSPKQNREIPELIYDRVYKIKNEFPELHIGINGGVTSIGQIEEHVPHIDEVMIGRAAYQSPLFLRELAVWQDVDQEKLLTIEQVVDAMREYAAREYKENNTPLHSIARHMMGLFQGMPGARSWRQNLSRISVDRTQDSGRLLEAIPKKNVTLL